MSKYLVFSHGFGVKKDDRGLIPDIAASFTSYSPVAFDYNIIDIEHNILTVRPLHEQAQMLQDQIDTVLKHDKQAEITLICHSQGCVVAALARPKCIVQAILLTPPGKVSAKRMQEFFARRPGASKERDGTLVVPRRDGSTTRIPQPFIDDLKNINPLKEYGKLAMQTRTIVIIAGQDEVLRKPVDLTRYAETIQTLTIDGDHNFTDQYRSSLIDTLHTILI